MVDPIRRALIKHPRDAYRNQVNVDHQYQQLNYCDVPDFKKSLVDYDTFAGLLESFGIEVHHLPEMNPHLLIQSIPMTPVLLPTAD